MRAVAVFPHQQSIRVVEHPEPGIKDPHEVKVRILDVGICGTDKEIANFEYGMPPAGEDYLVIGHEALGEVVETGEAVSRVRVGDLVVPMVRRPCAHPECLACREGRPDFCYTGDFTERGIKQAHGFMTEHVVDHERYMTPVPAHLRDVGVLVEPLTIAEKALLQVWDIQERLPWECREARRSGRAPQLRALVLGAGPVGLLGAMTLTRAGFAVHVYSREPVDSDKAAIVQDLGGRYVSARDVDVEQLPTRIGHVDLVYEAVGASKVAFDMLRMLGPNAVFVFTGVPGRKAPIEIDADTVMRNLVVQNQVLCGTVNAGPDAFEAAIRDLDAARAERGNAVDGLITGRYPLDGHGPLLRGELGGIKNVVDVTRPT